MPLRDRLPQYSQACSWRWSSSKNFFAFALKVFDGDGLASLSTFCTSAPHSVRTLVMNGTGSFLQASARNSSTPWMSFFLSRSGMAQTRNFSNATDSGVASAVNAPPTS